MKSPLPLLDLGGACRRCTLRHPPPCPAQKQTGTQLVPCHAYCCSLRWPGRHLVGLVKSPLLREQSWLQIGHWELLPEEGRNLSTAGTGGRFLADHPGARVTGYVVKD